MRTFKVSACLFLAFYFSIAFSHAQETTLLRLSVEESIMSALQNNFEIIIKRASPEIGKQNIKLAESEFDLSLFGEASATESKSPIASSLSSDPTVETTQNLYSAGFKQRLKLGTSYKLSFNYVQTETNSQSVYLDPEYSPNVQLSLSQPLLKGTGWRVNTTEIIVAKNMKEISDHDFTLKVMEVLTRTQEAYWDLVYLNMELKVLEESLERARDFLKRIELQVEVGVLAPIEITAAEAVVAVREEALIGIRHQIRNKQDALMALMNRQDAQPGSGTLIEPKDEPKYEKTALNLQELKETALEFRPDYKQAVLQIENRKRELAFNKNSRLPSLNLVGDVTVKGKRGTGKTFTDLTTGTTGVSTLDGSSSDALSDMGGGEYYDFTIGLVAEYPLFNRAAKSRVAKSALELNISETRLLSVRQAIELDVLRAARLVETAEQRIHATKASRVLAEKKLEAETKKYDVGASTIFTVLEYQNDLTAEQSKEIKAVTDYIKALARLELATGTVLKNHNISLASSP